MNTANQPELSVEALVARARIRTESLAACQRFIGAIDFALLALIVLAGWRGEWLLVALSALVLLLAIAMPTYLQTLLWARAHAIELAEGERSDA